MRALLVSILMLTACSFTADLSAQNIQLSNNAEINILTCGPFQGELYSAFGHSAIRIYDPVNGIDLLYNYGVFDFDQPNFYLNFARGNLNYKLAVMDYTRFRDYYIYYNRYIHEQVLNLNIEQKQKLFDFLEWNIKPENQYYLYDYFYDNCATRVRDALITTFGDDITFDGSYIETDYTIRDLTDVYLAKQPWGDLGIDICLGLPMDKTATPFMYMFLPDYIESGFNHATIKNDSTTEPLVKFTKKTYESRPEEVPSQIFTPLVVFSILLAIGILITYLGIKKQRLFIGFDVALFLVTGAIGLLLFLLWFATDHRAASHNFNLIWALPTNLVAGFLLLRKEKPAWLKGYFLFTLTLSILNVVFGSFLPQQLHYSLVPFVALISLRSYFLYRYLNRL